MKDLTTLNEHINLYEQSWKQHVPAPGDVYADRSPGCNGAHVIRLVSRKANGSWECVDAITGEPDTYCRTDETLKQYYRWISGDFDQVSSLARAVTEGKASDVAGLLTGGTDIPSDSESLMGTESPDHIAALLDASERIQNRMEEVHLLAKCMIERRKSELDRMLRDMNGYLAEMNGKVKNLLKVITVLNLYTGATVDVHQIVEGEPAPKDDPLCLRQQLLFMDEELCVHLDHEADYRDVPAFFEWLREPANRDIVAPESRCVVCLKPKRFDMNYRSGDAHYDAVRNAWNRHTYVVIRNGDNLFWLESEDLEVWDWAFPHEDFQESFARRMSEERNWKDHIQKEHDAVSYRITKYLMFLQGLVDQRADIFGSFGQRPNLLKLTSVSLIRDDENLLGTGRKPWAQFRDEKNALIRRGTRILYVAGPRWSDGYHHRPVPSSGKFIQYYANEWRMPEFPYTGLYSSDEVDVVDHYENRPVLKKYPRPVFKYLPGDKVWDRTEFEERERKKRVSWEYDRNAVLNYDAVTLDELRDYLEDRTLRKDFASMIPVLVRMKFYKQKEQEDEAAFKALLREDIRRDKNVDVSEGKLDEAVRWWKEKVIFTRPLRSDDRKAWNMIRAKILRSLK